MAPRVSDDRHDDTPADEALLALAVAGMFAACDWYESRNEKRAPREPGKARP